MDLSGIYFKILLIMTVCDRRWAARWVWADIFPVGAKPTMGAVGGFDDLAPKFGLVFRSGNGKER